jgi:hypothetical protein
MRLLCWLPLLSLAATACTPTRPDNGDLGGAKKDGAQAAKANGGSQEHTAGHEEKADFTWLTTPGVAGYQEIDIGHGRKARVVKEGTRAELVKLLSKQIATNGVVVQSRHNASLPAGSFTWYEVAGARALTVIYNPNAIPAAIPAVAKDERVVNHPALGEQVLHKQVEGKHGANGVAEVFVKCIENPAGFLNAHHVSASVVYDDNGTQRSVRDIQVQWGAGTTVTLTGGPCPEPPTSTVNCVVCAVATGQAVAKPVANSASVDVVFTPNNLLLKMY